MIGLAATAQIAIIPAWVGLGLVLGFPATDPTPLPDRSLALLLNVVAIVIASLGTYAAIGVKGTSLNCFDRKPEKAKATSLA
jgi:hypothetical protein